MRLSYGCDLQQMQAKDLNGWELREGISSQMFTYLGNISGG